MVVAAGLLRPWGVCSPRLLGRLLVLAGTGACDAMGERRRRRSFGRPIAHVVFANGVWRIGLRPGKAAKWVGFRWRWAHLRDWRASVHLTLNITTR